jgi:glycosyltransferase involved in cell wall biosynthesis
MTPKVDISCIITCYEKEDYLSECIESILRQSRQPKEIIVIHDGCKNPVSHTKTTTIILPENVGVAKARDIGFNYSTGTLILFIDGDDVLSPDYLEKMALVISEGFDIVYPDMFVWAGEDSYLSVAPMEITKEYVREKHQIPVPVTSLMHRRTYEKLGKFEEMPVLEDQEFMIRALCSGYKFKKAHTLLWWRRTPNTRNAISTEKKKEVLDKILSQV